MNRIVVDASVVLKWYLVDEILGEQALKILAQYLSGHLELFAPSLIDYEVFNGLAIALRRGRIDRVILQKAVEGFLNLEITVCNMDEFAQKILDILDAYDISSYDACYLALAETKDELFVTADKALYNAVGEELKYVKRLEEF